MPSENSVYRKIQVVLDVVKSVDINTIEELHREIRGRKYPNFETPQYSQEKDTFIIRQSDRVIRRIITFCRILGLIGPDGHLTKEGRRALPKIQFDDVIAAQIRFLLHHKSVNLSDLNRIILESLQSNPPVLPTSKELWTAVSGEINYSIFSRMLTLLAQCGRAQSSQKKIYLHIHSK